MFALALFTRNSRRLVGFIWTGVLSAHGTDKGGIGLPLIIRLRLGHGLYIHIIYIYEPVRVPNIIAIFCIHVTVAYCVKKKHLYLLLFLIYILRKVHSYPTPKNTGIVNHDSFPNAFSC